LSMINQMDPSMALIRSSPGYEIKENEQGYEIAVTVPKDMTASDLVVDMEDGEGTCLHITGQRETEEDGSRVRRYFEKSFMIGHDIDAEHITANLSNGLLVVKAPKVALESKKRPGIAITENPHNATASTQETGVHEIQVDSADALDDTTSSEEMTGTGTIPVNTIGMPSDGSSFTDQAGGRQNLNESAGLSYGTPTSVDDTTGSKKEVPHENTRYMMADHKNETCGPSKEYPAG
jgi:HSP20 family molecular chaperone IbpA